MSELSKTAASQSMETYICTLTPELQDKALKELNEKPQWRSRDIQALREMILAHKGVKTTVNLR